MYGTELIIHSFLQLAKEFETGIHISFPVFQEKLISLQGFTQIGVSIHSVREAVFAANRGADYLIAGHIFATDCKKGVEPRGLAFLQDICEAVSIPVFAIGGISPFNACDVIMQGASGICVMSGLMTSSRPDEEIASYQNL